MSTHSPDLSKKSHAKGRLSGHLAILAFATLIAGSFSLGNRAAPFIDPVAITAVRFALASLLMGTLVVAIGPRLEAAHFRAAWRYFALGGLLALYFVLMFTALQIAEPVSTGAVFTLIPAMSALFGWLLLRQRTSAVAAAAIAVGALGASWVIFDADLDRLLAFEVGRGEAIYFIGCAAHALYTPLVPRLNRGEPVMVFTLGALLAATVLITAWGTPALLETDWATLPAIVWWCVGYLAVFTTAGTFFLLQYAAMRLPAGKVMAYGYLTPVFIVLLEGASGQGWPVPEVWLGVAVIATALLLLVSSRD